MTTPTNRTIALTYANEGLTDGAGAQLQRIYGVFALSRLINVPYIHSPLSRVGYQGLTQLISGSPDEHFSDRFNQLLAIPSDDYAGFYERSVYLPNVEPGFHGPLVQEALKSGVPTLVKVLFPFGVTELFPDAYDICKSVSPFKYIQPPLQGRDCRIAIHVRRGELHFSAPDRIIPNSYYINVCKKIMDVIIPLGFHPIFELHTEVSDSKVAIPEEAKEWAITPPFENAVVDPADDMLSDFDAIPNLVRCYNEPATVTLQKLATADILIMSKSSFSYVASVLNPRGVTLYYDFWHKPASSWIITDPDGSFNEQRFVSRLVACCGRLEPSARPIPPAPGVNIALGKPTSQSSPSPYSTAPSNTGGNNGIISGLFGFHTDREFNPWWQVDLEQETSIREIRVFNRMDCCSDRARTLKILGSSDGENWTLIHDQAGHRFGGNDGHPLQVLPVATSARFIRLQLEGLEFLHLDEVEIYQ